MARIVKLIWRLDYDVSYAYLDKRGSALNALANTVEGFWDTVGDGAIYMSFAARASRDSRVRVLSLEHNSTNGSIEWTTGTELNRALQDDSFHGIRRIVREVFKVGDIRVLRRAGIRLFCIGNYADGRRGRDRVINLLDEKHRKNTAEILGPIDDMAIILEGKTEDKINYRVTYGPYDKKNIEQTLEIKPTAAEYELLGEPDLFFDIDLYETNFTFVEHSLHKWAETKVAKAIDFIALCDGSPMKDLGTKNGGRTSSKPV